MIITRLFTIVTNWYYSFIIPQSIQKNEDNTNKKIIEISLDVNKNILQQKYMSIRLVLMLFRK